MWSNLFTYYFPLSGGVTYHSAFSLKTGNSICYMSDKTKAELRHNLADLKLLIIDEISMAAADHIYRIHKRLCEILQMDEDIHPFANINVLFVGDLLQLPPVLAHQVFREPKNDKLKTFHNGLGEKSLWKTFQPMILKHNHRQSKAGRQWADTLNRLREGIVKPEDDALLRSRLTDEEFLDDDALHVFYLNKDVTEHNTKMLNKLPNDLISVKAIQALPKGRKSKIDKGKKTIEDTEFLETFEFKIGARVTIVKNIDLIDDLFNGAGGTVVGVEYNKNGVFIASLFNLTLKHVEKNKEPNILIWQRSMKNTMAHPYFAMNTNFNLKQEEEALLMVLEGNFSNFH